MLLDVALLDELTAQAKASPRLRMNFDLRNTPSDQSQRMLNALEPGTVMPIHRHRNSSETVVMLRGKVKWLYYNEKGELTDTFIVAAGSDIIGLSSPRVSGIHWSASNRVPSSLRPKTDLGKR